MKMISNNILANRYYKAYDVSEEYDIKNILNSISSSGLTDIKVYIDEDIDRNLKSIQGSYDIKELMETGENLISNAYDYTCVSINISGIIGEEKVMLVIWPSEKSITLVTNNKDLSINNIVKLAKIGGQVNGI